MTEPEGGTRRGTGTADQASGGTRRYSVPQVARVLGISERAVRKRIDAGTLAAEKEGRSWVVFLPEPGGGTGAAEATEPAAPAEPDAVPRPPAGSTDLAPLAALVEKLAAENADLKSAATLWQERARVLEARLLQLGAGDVQGAAGDAVRSHEREAGPEPGADAPSPWRRLWRAIGGR